MIIPFDSGTFMSKRYDNIFPDNYINKEMLLKQFSIGNNIEVLRKFINDFYGNNENYLSGDCYVDNKIAVECSMEALINLLKSKGNFAFDDRAKTVEIICNKNIELNKVAKAIVFPKNHKYFKDFKIKKPQIEIIEYKTHYPLCPILFNEAIFQKSYDYIVKRIAKGFKVFSLVKLFIKC